MVETQSMKALYLESTTGSRDRMGFPINCGHTARLLLVQLSDFDILLVKFWLLLYAWMLIKDMVLTVLY